MKFKPLYEFEVTKVAEVPETTVSTDEEGNEVQVTKKVTKEIALKFALKKPTRSEIESGEFFYHKTVGQGIDGGLISAPLLAKRLANDGGVLTEDEKDEYSKKFIERVETEMIFQKIASIAEVDRTDEQKEELLKAIEKIGKLTRALHDLELRQQTLFEITAEANARTKTIVWWLLLMLYKKNDAGEWIQFFDGDSHKFRQESYDDYMDDDENSAEEIAYTQKILNTASQATALWYYGRAKKQEEFVKALEELAKIENGVKPY